MDILREGCSCQIGETDKTVFEGIFSGVHSAKATLFTSQGAKVKSSVNSSSSLFVTFPEILVKTLPSGLTVHSHEFFGPIAPIAILFLIRKSVPSKIFELFNKSVTTNLAFKTTEPT